MAGKEIATLQTGTHHFVIISIDPPMCVAMLARIGGFVDRLQVDSARSVNSTQYSRQWLGRMCPSMWPNIARPRTHAPIDLVCKWVRRSTQDTVPVPALAVEAFNVEQIEWTGVMHGHVTWNSAGQQIEQKFKFKFAYRESVGDSVTKIKSIVLCIQD